MEKLNFRNRRRKNAYIIDERLSQRAVSLANYMIENKSTVRQAAKVFGVSKSTVHKDLTERLENIDSSLAGQVREVLDLNKSERHIRGGMATKEKYAYVIDSVKNDKEIEIIVSISLFLYFMICTLFFLWL